MRKRATTRIGKRRTAPPADRTRRRCRQRGAGRDCSCWCPELVSITYQPSGLFGRVRQGEPPRSWHTRRRHLRPLTATSHPRKAALTETSQWVIVPTMVESQRPSFQVSLSEAQLRAPETPHYLELAMRLLEARLAEFQDGAVPSTPPQQPNDSVDITIQSGDPLQPSQPHPQPPQAQAPGRRTRWFQVQLPRITLEDGSQVTPTPWRS